MWLDIHSAPFTTTITDRQNNNNNTSKYIQQKRPQEPPSPSCPPNALLHLANFIYTVAAVCWSQISDAFMFVEQGSRDRACRVRGKRCHRQQRCVSVCCALLARATPRLPLSHALCSSTVRVLQPGGGAVGYGLTGRSLSVFAGTGSRRSQVESRRTTRFPKCSSAL